VRTQHKKPALVCINNGNEPPTLTRYVPKPTGGFYSETFTIEDPEECARALNVETMERFRLGKMRDQVTPQELEDQYA
jgi:hypothetical protein